MRNKHEDIEFWNRPENKSFDFNQHPKCTFINCNMYLQKSNQFKCFHCEGLFCSEHSFVFNHKCSKIENNKKEELKDTKSFEKIIHPKCSFNECNIKMDLCNRFTCTKCNKVYCASHRIDFTHNC